ncbi:VIT family protein [Weissella coleopterorum]|uniref:VIT family protein n=1 Tax=Weissella coleopterorum TaxID=2714949 RepID=A0A6G8B0Z9_9LACO|nr:VIT family protein [Weissella coleopterorum]QIL50910.1 VIT family protein [Weissella coleopterorum]
MKLSKEEELLMQNGAHKHEKLTLEERLNVVRAGVLGANDGVLTVVGVLFSVGAATNNSFTLLIAGVSDLLACALSMASGEYASVSSQSDAEKVVVQKEAYRIKEQPALVEADLEQFYVGRGVSDQTATLIAKDLMQKQPLKAILETKYDVQLGHYVNPWEAALSSMICAALAGVVPLLAMVLLSRTQGMLVAILATTVASAIIGWASAKLGQGFVKKSIIRNIIIGLLTITIHYGIGLLF